MFYDWTYLEYSLQFLLSGYGFCLLTVWALLLKFRYHSNVSFPYLYVTVILFGIFIQIGGMVYIRHAFLSDTPCQELLESRFWNWKNVPLLVGLFLVTIHMSYRRFIKKTKTSVNLSMEINNLEKQLIELKRTRYALSRESGESTKSKGG